MKSIAVLVPTIGRTTLARAVNSATQAKMFLTGDQVIVVGDGDLPAARAMLRPLYWAGLAYLEIEHVGDWGSTPLDHAIAFAKADYLFFLGDDDYLLPDAMAAMHAAIENDNGKQVHIFNADFCGREFPGWSEHGFDTQNRIQVEAVFDGQRQGNAWIGHCGITGQQILVPNDRNFLPTYAEPHPQGLSNDWAFIERVLKRSKQFGYGVNIWSQKVVKIEAQNGGRFF